MNSKFKRLLACLLSLMMVVSLFPMSAITAFAAEADEADEIATISEGPVAKVGNTEYATIDEAIAAWTNGTTLTLLSDVTLSDVVTLKSTEHHILNLGTYTMTAASGKNAIVIKACGNGSAEKYAITINADATNPGGINAGKKSVIYYKYADGGISTEDRPIIMINGGVFTGSSSSFGTAGIYTIGTAARKCATLNISGGTFNCSINGSSKSKLLISGGTFNYSVGSQGDSTALRLISGGKFKTLGFMTADSNNTKFWFGTSMANSNVGLFVDAEGYLNVGGPVITELSAKYPAVASNATKWSSYLAYSSAATYGLFYEDADMAIAKHGEANVTIYSPISIQAGENVDATDEQVAQLTGNGAAKDEVELPEGVETLVITLSKVTDTKLTFNVEPKDVSGTKVPNPASALTFRLPVPDGWEVAKVYHEGTLVGTKDVKEGNYVEVTSSEFSEFVVEKVTYVAKVGEQGYESLAAAINAATAGQTVTLLTDVNGNVTINKSLTIDGNGKTYTGTMTANDNLTVTVQNVNFVNGGIAKTTKSANGNYTIKDCTFDGEGKYAYALSFKGANKITVEDCTVRNYMYGFLYVSSGTINVSVKDVTVENCPSYAVYFGSSVNTASFENLTVKNSSNGFVLNNTANREFTVKNCTMENVGTAINHSKGTNTITCTVLGVNDFGGAALSQYATVVAEAQVGNYYGDFAAVINKAQDGETVKLLSNFTLTDEDIITANGRQVMANVDSKAITLDMNGKKITVNYAGGQYLYAVIRVADGASLTVTGDGAIDIPSNGINVAYMFWKAGTTGTLNVKNGTYHMDNSAESMVYTNGHKIVTIEGGTWTLDAVGTRENRFPCIFSAQGTGSKSIIVTGGTYNDDINHQHWGDEAVVDKTCYVVNNGDGTWTVKSGAVAYVNLGIKTGPYFVAKDFGFATFEEAWAAAGDGNTITLLQDVTLDTMLVNTKKITLNLNGKTITGTDNTSKNFSLIDNRGELTITGNGKMTLIATVNSGWNRYSAVIANNPGGKLIIENGTIEHLGGTDMAYGIDNLTNGKGTYAETIINGGTIKSIYRGIRQFLNGVEAQNILTINGGTVEGANKAIFFHDPSTKANSGTITVAEGATINGGVYLFVTEGSTEWPVTVSIAASAVNGDVTTKNVPEGYVVENKDGTYGVRPANYVVSVNGVKYESLAAAIKAATAGSTITLLADVNENVTINKNLTIDGADKNYTGMMTVNNVTVTIENVNFVKGQVYKHKSTGNNANITVKNCDFDGQGMDAYAINLGGTSAIVIENVTAKDYGYGLLQVPSSCAGLTVKNVTVSGCYYGLKVDYANAVTIENADIDATVGIYDSNFGTKTYTITNSKISTISIWQRNTTNYTTFKFEGVNEVATLSTSAYAKYTGVQVGTKIYDSLANAWAAAQDGDTIKVLGNIAVSDAITNTKKVTLDLNGKTITGTDNATGSFAIITNKGQLTITGNGKITLVATNNRGWSAYSSVISNTVGGKLIVENGTIEHLGGTDMAYGIDNLTNGKGTYAETIINGGTIKSTYRAIRMFLNGIEADNILTVNGGTIEGANKSIWVQDPSKNANTGKITVAEGATLNGDVYLTATAGSTEWPVEVSIAASAVKDEVLTSNLPAGYVLEKKSGNWTVNEYFFKVGNKYYKDLQAAVNAASQYQSVVLLQDAEGAGVVINKKISIDFAGFTYTITAPVGSKGTESNGFQILAGNYAVRLLNGTLKVADSAADKFYILVQNYADLTVQKMTLDGTNLDKYAFTDGDSYTLSNNSGNVNINMSTIIANNDGDKAFAFDACDKSAWGYELPRVIVYTGSKIVGKIEAVAKVGNYYDATLQQAIDATAEGKTITLLAPIVVNAGETLSLNKKVTISYTSNVAGEDMITNRGTVIVDGATLVYKNTDTTANNVTVSTISCEPGSVLEVKNGVVKNNSANNGILGIYAYAIDMLTNGNLGDVTVTISGGEVIGTNYMAIRQFNNGTACKNTLNVTGGYIYGAKRAIQIHMKNNAAYLTISGGEIEAGDYALCLLTTSENIEVVGGEFKGAIWYSGTDAFITGGTFDATVDEAYIVDGYKLNKVDGAYTVIVDTAYGKVATIGDKGYSSLAEAWADAQSGDTIVLQNNIAIDTETFTVADGKKITLDMNGYTITVTDNATANYELFYIYGEMVVTGKGTIELTSTNNRAWNAMSAIFHNRGGVLIIENGTFKNLGGTDMAWVVDNSGNHYGDAKTNIMDGELTSTYTAIRNRMEQNTHGASGKAILNVYGGTIDGTTSAIWAQAASTSTVAPATGEINIYGGNIGLINTARSAGAVSLTTISGGTVAGFKGESGELKVTGGTITGDITICFADGEVAEKIVKKSNVYYAAVAKINKTYYATLADAIKANTGAQAVTLIRDVEASGFVVTKKMSLDLNGHTLTLTAPVGDTGCGIQINTDKAVRIVNGTLKAADNAGINVLIENNGSALTIQKQTIKAAGVEKVLVVNSGSASLNYATINAEGAIAFEVNGTAKVTVYTSSKIAGTINAKKSGSHYTAK